MTHTWNGGPHTSREVGRSHRLWWLDRDEGVTLVRDDAGEWTEVRGVLMDSQLRAYTLVLRGGYTIDVSEDTYDELVAAGYGSYFV